MAERPWVLVTGAAGFVGGHLVRLLTAHGERVRAFVRPGASLDAFVGLPRDRFELAYGDVTIEHTVYRALAGCDRLYHLAAAVRFWDARPERIWVPAIEGTRAVLSAARLRSLRRVVVTSSATVLGTTGEPLAMDERHPPSGPEPEPSPAATRRALEVAEEQAAAGLPLVIVMPTAIAGPEDRRPTPIGASVLRYLRARIPLPAVPGGASLVDVEDVARGHWLAMEHGIPGRRYLLGGENVTYEGMLTALSQLTGLPPPRSPPSARLLLSLAGAVELGARVTGREPPITRRQAAVRIGRYSWVTSARAERELGYAARPLTETLRRAVTWFVNHGRVPDRLARRLRYELEAR